MADTFTDETWELTDQSLWSHQEEPGCMCLESKHVCWDVEKLYAPLKKTDAHSMAILNMYFQETKDQK